uniref:Orally active insecticidal peptide n=1 Tax=Selenotypus plumipes TaxID=1395661 RepID=TX31A_SELPU|nr:RecName: Full=Orally active insecticidal peptide; Short=Toxin OAIP 2; Flags: Precursor [Selenotypus plumipes]
MRVLFIIAGLALLSVVCYTSEMKERSSFNEVLSEFFAADEPQERDCLGQWASCEPKNSKCCPNYACTWKYPWCRYRAGK